MAALKTDESLLRALRVAASHKITKEELHKQRISFIMGSLKNNSTVTQDQIDKVLAEQSGDKDR